MNNKEKYYGFMSDERIIPLGEHSSHSEVEEHWFSNDIINGYENGECVLVITEPTLESWKEQIRDIHSSLTDAEKEHAGISVDVEEKVEGFEGVKINKIL